MDMVPLALPSTTKKLRPSMRFSIGAKFLILIATTLLIALGALIFNASRLFKTDNLDTISLSSDLLTAAKSGQVRSWSESVLFRANNILSAPKKSAAAIDEPEILFVRTSELSGSEHSWQNHALLKKFGIDATVPLPQG